VEEPDSASLLGAMNAEEDLQDIVAFCIHIRTLGNFHVHIHLNWCLEVGQDIINLKRIPIVDNHKDQDEVNDCPFKDRA